MLLRATLPLAVLFLVAPACDSKDSTASKKDAKAEAKDAKGETKDAKDADAKADLYSLGATLFHGVSGELPFAATDLGIATPGVSAPPLSSTLGPVPEGLATLVAQLLAYDPADRPENALVVQEALAALR